MDKNGDRRVDSGILALDNFAVAEEGMWPVVVEVGQWSSRGLELLDSQPIQWPDGSQFPQVSQTLPLFAGRQYIRHISHISR